MASMVQEMRLREMLKGAAASGRGLEPYVNHRPYVPPTQGLAELGWNGKYTNGALATVNAPNFQMGETPEYKAAQAAKPRVDLSGYKPAPVNPMTGEYAGQAAAKSSMPSVVKPQGAMSRMSAAVPPGLAKLGTAVGVGLEGANVAKVAMNPNSTGMDVAQQTAEGAGKLAAAGLGAKAGAALGALGGPVAPLTVPAGAVLGGLAGYAGAGKLMEAGRSMAGTDPRAAVDRLTPSAPQPTVQQQASYSNEGRREPNVNPAQNANAAAAETQASDVQPQSLARQVMPGVFRQGNSYGGTPEKAAEFAGPRTVSPQNMAAADALATRYQSNPLVQAAQQPVNQNFTPADNGQGTGYGLLNSNRIAQRNAMMDVQQLKPGSGKALAALLQQQGEAPKLNLERDQMAQRGQESVADRAMRREELSAKLGESAADRALKGQELADNSLTNAAKREALGIETGAAKQMADLRTQYMNAKTPEEQAAVAAKINALSGKVQQDEVMAIDGGETVDATGNVLKNPQQLVNKRTGQPVNGGQQAKAAQFPNAPSAGTVKGGYRYKGGDPAQPSSWEKV